MRERSGMPYDVVAYEADERTFDLSLEEEAIFHRMMRKAWMNGSVPADLDKLAQICRVNPRTMRKVWPKVSLLWEPMEPNSDRIISKKMESERNFLEEKRNLARIAGKASAKSRQTKKVDSTDVQLDRSTSHPNPTVLTPIVPTTSSNPAEFYAPEFEENFWRIYPKKVGKGDAHAVWRKLKPSAATQEKIQAAILTFSRSAKWLEERGRFIPNPATFLRQRRWDDDLQLPTASPRRASLVL